MWQGDLREIQDKCLEEEIEIIYDHVVKKKENIETGTFKRNGASVHNKGWRMEEGLPGRNST